MAGTPDAKPRKRIVLSARAYGKLRAELMQKWPRDFRGLAVHGLHHFVARGAGGDDVEDNLVPLNGSGTTGTHGDVEGNVGTARADLRVWLEEKRPDVIRYAIGRKGDYWLDRHYPKGAA